MRSSTGSRTCWDAMFGEMQADKRLLLRAGESEEAEEVEGEHDRTAIGDLQADRRLLLRAGEAVLVGEQDRLASMII